MHYNPPNKLVEEFTEEELEQTIEYFTIKHKQINKIPYQVLLGISIAITPYMITALVIYIILYVRLTKKLRIFQREKYQRHVKSVGTVEAPTILADPKK